MTPRRKRMSFLHGLAAGMLLCATGTAAQESLPPPAQAPAQESSRAYDRRAEALMAEGRLEEAREALARALAMEPDNGRALFLSQQLRRAASAPDARLPPLDLAGAPLEAQDFARLTLSGIAAADAHAPRSDWSNSRLEGVTLLRAQLFEANFQDARWTRVNLDGAVLDRANLRNGSFAGVSLVRARAPQLQAQGASLVGARAVAADFQGSNFEKADFSGADLRATNFTGANLNGARLANADLRGADLAKANLAGALLKGARVDCATRFPTGFNAEANLVIPLDLCGGAYALDYRNRDLAGMSFRDLDLRGGLFAGARLAGADFTAAILDGADFAGAAGFDGAFAPVSAREAGFEGISGTLTTLGATDLRNARISGAEGGDLMIVVGPGGPRLEGATLASVRLLLDYRLSGGEAAAGAFAGLLRARVESGSIECGSAPERSARREEAAAYAETLDAARKLAAANPGVALGESCRRR